MKVFTNNNNNILSLNIFQRLIALSELKFYDKADLEMRNLYSQLGKRMQSFFIILVKSWI